MDELRQLIAKLDPFVLDLQEKHRVMQEATAAFAGAATTGTGDLTQLLERASSSSQRYQEVRTTVLALMHKMEEQFRLCVDQARACGVPFQIHPAERLRSNGPLDDFSPPKLMGGYQQVRDGLDTLASAIEMFGRQQEQLAEAFTVLKGDLERVERYAPEGVEDIRALERDLTRKYVDVTQPRDSILIDVHELITLCREQANTGLQERISRTYADVKSSLVRLEALQAQFEEQVEAYKRLDERLDNPLESHDQLLDDLQIFLQDCTALIERVSAEINQQIDKQFQEAEVTLAKLHSQMPEARELRDLLAQRQEQGEADLVGYRSKLEVKLAQAQKAGINALERYQQGVSVDRNYLFTEQHEVEQIGMALVTAAELPEQYSGPLWDIGEDIVYRLEMGDFGAQEFRQQFVYLALERALRSASERNEVDRVLIFLNADFLLPPGDSPAARIRTLLQEPLIREFFGEASLLAKLRLDPDRSAQFSEPYLKAVLTFLEHAETVDIPNRVQLQWIAALHGHLASQSPLHYTASYLLLCGLLREERYISLYYALNVLGAQHPSLWNEPAFRPMLWRVIEQALALGADSRSFLTELCNSSGIEQLIADDFTSKFLFASIAHYLTIHLGQSKLWNRAWNAWEHVIDQYPALVNVLRRQLQGESIEGMVVDAAELNQEYDRLLGQISDKLPSPGYAGVRLALAIHRWYASEHMQQWLQNLRSKRLSQNQLAQLLSRVVAVRQDEDLVEACPLQHTPPDPAMRPIEGRLKDKLNSRLSELLDLFMQAIKVRQRLASNSQAESLQREAMLAELRRMHGQFEPIDWAVMHLLKPELPFINELIAVL